MYSTRMPPNLTAAEWLGAVSARLHECWPTIDPQRLEDVAFELFSDPALRALPPLEAAEKWLRPVLALD
jgi:hypothetical protein